MHSLALKRSRMGVAIICSIAACCAGPAFAQQGDGTTTTISATVFKPAKVAATTDLIASLEAPKGVAIDVFAEGLKNARVVAVSEQGHVYISRRDQGDVVLLQDKDGDGKVDADRIIVAQRAGAHVWRSPAISSISPL